MTVATDQRVHLSDSLQRLIDSRLDTIDRMLLGRVERAERMAIVREVESQVHELLAERATDELCREDVLAVLARLDPPEAFLPEEFASDVPATVRGPLPQPAARSMRRGNGGVARTSGILGLTALCSLLIIPLSYLPALLFQSEMPVILAALVTSLGMFICGVVGLAMGVYSRKSGVWALVGMVTSIPALVFALVMGVGLILLS